MSKKTRFGVWSLLAAIGWITGLIMAGIVIYHLWTDWSPM
jgi:hypothetical protein